MTQQPEANALTILTIGHGAAMMAKLLELLKANQIEVVVDVRSTPASRHQPQFNREQLEAALKRAGLDYRYAGEFLGGRPKEPDCYKNGKVPSPNSHPDYLNLVDYAKVMTKEWYQRGIRRLLEIAATQRTVVLCSEEQPERCHRQNLIAQSLLREGHTVLHIRHSGELQKAWRISLPSSGQDGEPAEQLSLL